MVNIARTRAAGAGANVSRIAAARSTSSSAPVTPSAGVEDATSVLGIPESEFTPKVRAAIMALLEEVQALRAELESSKQRVAHLEKLADEDALVPVANRRAFVRELSRMLSYAQRYGAEMSVLYLDVNDMKRVNDTYGHPAGDAAIAHIANLLSESVRESDVVGRLGGDEFGVILANANEEAARAKAEFLVDTLAKTPLIWEGHEIPLAVTFGVYSLQAAGAGDGDGEANADTMIAQADRAMYARKARPDRGAA